MTGTDADLRSRVVEALNGAQKPDVGADRHDEHQFDASCFVCRGDVEKLTDAVLPLLTEAHADRGRATDEVNQLRAEVERLTAGADPTPAEPGTVLSPGQWIARWNAAIAEERLEQVRHLQDMADRAGRCFLLDHEGRLEEEVPMLRQEIERLRAKLARVEWTTTTPDDPQSSAMDALLRLRRQPHEPGASAGGI